MWCLHNLMSGVLMYMDLMQQHGYVVVPGGVGIDCSGNEWLIHEYDFIEEEEELT